LNKLTQRKYSVHLQKRPHCQKWV